MTSDTAVPSARKAELLELAYAYAIQHGRTDLSLRPMAAAIGSSPRVLLYLFGSKDGLIRALLARSRADELRLISELRQVSVPAGGPAEAGERIWAWLAAEAHRPLLRLWLDGYSRSVSEPDGPWAGFGAATVHDWLAILAGLQPRRHAESPAGAAERTLLLAVLRGGLLDLLATGETTRVGAAIRYQLTVLRTGSAVGPPSSVVASRDELLPPG
ncbi:MAG TPA: TetR/AcrR family transcriptional regulator [Streptosporangiaceae bacterium]